jgi:nitronate monooxygenase
LPIGIGVINWGASLTDSIPIIHKYQPAALWFFSPSSTASLIEWTESARKASPNTKIWVQIGSVTEAADVLRAMHPDVLVVQGTDAGGHGRAQGASLITLLPEVIDTVQTITSQERISYPIMIAAGGIVESRSAAAAFVLGASGVVMGTRFLASPEANISKGYQNAVLSTVDGGQTTVRTKVYDDLRGTTGWAETYNARGIINKSYTDSVAGLHLNENKKLYEEEVGKGDAGWGVTGRMTTYAGAGVGLVREVTRASEIVEDVRRGAKALLEGFGSAAVAGKL